MIRDEILGVLRRNSKGRTAREIAGACPSAPELKVVVNEIHALKSDGQISADGMRDSQVVYKALSVAGPAAQKQEPMPPATTGNISRTRRSVAGLSERLFEVMDKLASGEMDANKAKTFAALGLTLLKAAEVQLEYERMKLEKKIPGELTDMPLALEQKT